MNTRDLTLNVKSDTRGLKNIATAGKKTAGDLQRQNKKTESTFKRLSKSISGNKIALAGMAVAAFIAYRKLSDFISRSISESAEQVRIFATLEQTLSNIGVAYESVKDKLSQTFELIQRTTEFGDTEQAAVLQKLIAFTGSYEAGLRALNTTIDFSVGAGLDLNSAARLVGQALDGNVAVLTRYESSLKGLNAETFKALTENQRLDIVLGALDKRYKGSAVIIGNTWVGAVAQAKNAQGDLREAVGDFITQSPLFISLIKEIADSYLDAADAVTDYREDQEKGNQLALDAIDKLEGLAISINFVVRLLGVLGNAVAVLFSSLGAVATQLNATFQNALAGLLDFRLVIASIAEKIPGLGRFAFDEGEVLAFRKRIADLEQAVTDAQPKLESSLDSIKENIAGFFDNLGKLGDSTFIEGIFDRARKRAEGLVVSLIPVREILPEVGGALDDAAEDAKELGEELKTVTEIFEDFVDANNLFELARKSNPTQGPALFDDIFGDAEDLAEAEEQITGTLSAIGVFAADIASNINDSFANTLTELIFDFKNFGDSIKNVFRSIVNSFFQLLATIATNPIRIGIEQSLSGGGGSVVGAGGSILGIGGAGGLFGSSGSFTALGALFTGNSAVGFLSTLGAAIPAIGAIIAAVAIAVPLILKAFEKTPRLDLDFDTLRDNAGKSLGIAAQVFQFLDEEFFANEIFNNSVSRQAGLGLKGKIAPVIQEAIEGTIFAIQDIINQLPTELSLLLSESLLNTAVDIESKVKGDRLLEFDETKKIKEKFEQFINGDLQARFLFSIREFFVGAFESLGVLGQAAQDFIDQEFENFQGLNREERAIAGQQLLADFQTLTDAFNVLNNNGGDAIGATVNSLKNLASTLGFDAIPSIEELDKGLQELVNAAELDPSVIQDFLDLRNAILQVQGAILNSISSIIGKISQLNSITGASGNLGGFINGGLDTTIGLLGQEGLSSEDTEALLDIGVGFLNQLISEEQAAFNAAQDAIRAANEAQIDGIQARISGLQAEKNVIEDVFNTRLDALNEELQLAQDFARLTESIKNTLDSILFSSESVLTPIEQVGILQSRITGLQNQLSNATDPLLKLDLAEQLESAFDTLFGTAGGAFGVNSPEFVSIFDQVTTGLSDLAELTASSSRSLEQINADIEILNIERNQQLSQIDSRIESLQQQLSSLSAQNVQATFQVSDRVQELADFFTNGYIDLLNDRFEQLAEIDAQGFEAEIDALTSIDHTLLEIAKNTGQSAILAAEDAITLREGITALQSTVGGISGAIQNYLDAKFDNVAGFAHGSSGFKDFGSGTLTMLHGIERVQRPGDVVSSGTSEVIVKMDIQATVNGGSRGAVDTVATNIEDMMTRTVEKGGRFRAALQKAAKEAP